MSLIVNIFFVLVHFVLWQVSPAYFSYEFCALILFLFILQNVIYFLRREFSVSVLSFEFFFGFSFLLCNFIYPVFYYETRPTIGMFQFGFNDKVITSSTALAGLAYSCFILGVTSYSKKSFINNFPRFRVEKIHLIILLYFSMFCFLGYIGFGGLRHLDSVYSEGGVSIAETGVFSYFNILFNIGSFILAIYVFCIEDKKLRLQILAFLLITMLCFALVGSRTVVISRFLILLFGYSLYVKRIKTKVLLLGILFGSFLMYSIVVIRSGFSVTNSVIVSFFDIYLDLITTNRNLYVLTDFADNNFKVYFLSAVYSVTSVVPGLSSFINNSFQLNSELLAGGWPTYLEFGSGSTYGLGTSLVGEMYFSFGIIGVVIISLLLGTTIKYLKFNLNKRFCYILYFLFVANAVFYPRAFYLLELRNLIWSIVILFLLERILGKKMIKLF
ncbi:oligosaccharide repeat unit polymerase [Myroides marinus]|uniref:O-antigen polymerase n=1 Tax=Myroides marinus TaxID=703342 RepID=UPI002574B6B0|nr:O-antigen polymerase [Myroides marinus]MDM1384252.1 oligosaccharide repeat unit polymerase [Myroides marinus]